MASPLEPLGPLVRIALVNYGNITVTLNVDTNDQIQVRPLLKEGPVNESDGPPTPYQKGSNPIDVPAGTIIGFSSRAKVTVTNASTVNVSVISANGKDPWPKPPPAAPLGFEGVADYKQRFENFLLTDGVGTGHLPTVMILVPAEGQ